MEVAFRLLVAGFVIVAPTLLFLGLLRGLNRLSRDRLVDRALDRVNGATPRLSTDSMPFAAGSVAPRPSSRESVTCAACGRENPRFASFCDDCLGSLDDGARGE